MTPYFFGSFLRLLYGTGIARRVVFLATKFEFVSHVPPWAIVRHVAPALIIPVYSSGTFMWGI